MRPIKYLLTGIASVTLALALVLPALSQTGTADTRTFRSSANYGQRFQEIIEMLQKKYVNPDAVKSEEELFKIAIDSMLKAIGDKHGTYFTDEGLDRMHQDLRPDNYSGVGVKVGAGTTGLIIMEIFEGSGLSLMGIHVGDVITRAHSDGGTDVTWDGQNIKELVSAIKGPVGSDVFLTLTRGSTNLAEIVVPRIETRQQFVFMDLEENGILTIRITQFSSTIHDDIISMLHYHGWLKNGVLNTDIVKAVTIDLRSNPGGSLKSSVETADIFMPKNVTVVRIVQPPDANSDGRAKAIDFVTKEDRIIPNTIPRVMLVNALSASASEIVSGATKKYKEMPIFGTKTYGKGSVQTIFSLSGGGGFKTTTAIYFAGGDVEIDGIGVTPDSEIQQPEAPGMSPDDKRINGNIIRKSMDPTIDYQLGVAHKYLKAFLTGGYSMKSQDSVREATNKAHGAPKAKWDKKFCDEKGLRGCPPTAGFTGNHPNVP